MKALDKDLLYREAMDALYALELRAKYTDKLNADIGLCPASELKDTVKNALRKLTYEAHQTES